MTPEQIQQKLETSLEAWMDHCESRAKKKLAAAFKEVEARGEPVAHSPGQPKILPTIENQSPAKLDCRRSYSQGYAPS